MAWGEKVPGDFYAWVRSYLSGAGYDYKTVDIDSLYDSTLSKEENYNAIKREWPPQTGTKREEQLHHTTKRMADAYDQEGFARGVESRIEERKTRAKEAYEEAPFKRTQERPPDFVDEYVEPKEEKEDFITGVKKTYSKYLGEESREAKLRGEKPLKERYESFREEMKQREYEARRSKEKGEEIKQRLKIRETEGRLAKEEREARLKDLEVQRRKTRVENIKRTLNPLEGYVDKPQPTPYRRAPSPTPMRTTSEGSRLAESLDVSESVRQNIEARPAGGDRYGLDLYRPSAYGGGRPVGADRYGLDLFAKPGQQQYAPGQKRYKYRTIIEHGVARRERIPQVGPEGQPIPGRYPYQPQRSSLRESMDVLRPGRMQGRQQQSGMAASLDIFNHTPSRTGRSNPVPHEVAHRAELSQPSGVKPGKSKPVQYFGKMNLAPAKVNASSGIKASSFSLPKMNFLGKPAKGRRGKSGRLGGYI